MHGSPRLTPEILLRAYAEGLFPMAERRGDPTLYWVSPDKRGIIPLDGFHVPRRLARTARSGAFTITSDRAFRNVMEACAAPGPGREESWINDEILRLYTALHIGGHAHSVECWQGDRLVGGLYGVRLGAAFFGESMFSRVRDASKVALVSLVEGLNRGGFVLLDTQFITAHLARFGAVEIPRQQYLRRLHDALNREAIWVRPE
jgi:leucyl/phenylalanyl-tRNA--protein transferase